MAEPIDGFYAVYLTSSTGNGAAMVVILNGKIAGADPFGVKIKGTCSRRADTYKAKVMIEVPPAGALLQGGNAGPDGSKYEIAFSFEHPLDGLPFRRIDTPLGPINAKFVKVSSFDD